MGGPHAAVGEACPDSRDSLTRAGLSILILVPFRRGLALGGGNYTAGSRSLGPLPELTADLAASGSGEGTNAVDSGFTCNCIRLRDGQSGRCPTEGRARHRQ